LRRGLRATWEVSHAGGALSIWMKIGTRQSALGWLSINDAIGVRARQASTAVPEPELSKIPPSASKDTAGPGTSPLLAAGPPAQDLRTIRPVGDT
jgi:hypothetical protein